MGRTTYIGFYIDWFIEVCANMASLIIIISSGSLSIGIRLYINAMVKDMENTLNNDDFPTESSSSSDRAASWSTYFRGIEFHNEIIGRVCQSPPNQWLEPITVNLIQFPSYSQGGWIIIQCNGSDHLQYDVDVYHCTCVQFICDWIERRAELRHIRRNYWYISYTPINIRILLPLGTDYNGLVGNRCDFL